MSATLRHDIGLELAEAVLGREVTAPGDSIFDLLGGKDVTRWAGLRRGGWTHRCFSFSIKLPKQVGLLHRLRHLLGQVENAVVGVRWGVQKQACLLHKKLWCSIGLPNPGSTVGAEEQAFLNAIHDSSGDDLSNWCAYADWLQDRRGEDDRRRGELIAGWLGPKAIKVKYGVPVLVNGKPWQEVNA